MNCLFVKHAQKSCLSVYKRSLNFPSLIGRVKFICKVHITYRATSFPTKFGMWKTDLCDSVLGAYLIVFHVMALTDGRTDGRYQTYNFPGFAVDKYVSIWDFLIPGPILYLNPHTDFWGPRGPQKTLSVAPTVINGTLEPISFIPAHAVFGVRWTP